MNSIPAHKELIFWQEGKRGQTWLPARGAEMTAANIDGTFPTAPDTEAGALPMTCEVSGDVP